jgi:hypothetical protein
MHSCQTATSKGLDPVIQKYAHSHLPERIGTVDYVLHQHGSPFFRGTGYVTSQQIEGSTFVLGMDC